MVNKVWAVLKKLANVSSQKMKTMKLKLRMSFDKKDCRIRFTAFSQ